MKKGRGNFEEKQRLRKLKKLILFPQKNKKTGRRPEEVRPSRGRGEGCRVREGVPGWEGPAVGGGEAGEEGIVAERWKIMIF